MSHQITPFESIWLTNPAGNVQLNPWLQHLIAQPVAFLYVPRETLESVGETLRSQGWEVASARFTQSAEQLEGCAAPPSQTLATHGSIRSSRRIPRLIIIGNLP